MNNTIKDIFSKGPKIFLFASGGFLVFLLIFGRVLDIVMDKIGLTALNLVLIFPVGGFVLACIAAAIWLVSYVTKDTRTATKIVVAVLVAIVLVSLGIKHQDIFANINLSSNKENIQKEQVNKQDIDKKETEKKMLPIGTTDRIEIRADGKKTESYIYVYPGQYYRVRPTVDCQVSEKKREVPGNNYTTFKVNKEGYVHNWGKDKNGYMDIEIVPEP